VQTQTRLGTRRVHVEGRVTPAPESYVGDALTVLLQTREDGRWRTHDSYPGTGMGVEGYFSQELDRPDQPQRCRLVVEYPGSPWLAPTRHRTQVDC
jgi:hypothetical protein